MKPDYKLVNENLEDYENRLYQEFYDKLVNLRTKVNFNGYFINTGRRFRNGKSETFYHVISLAKTNKYDIFQCENDKTQLYCASKCDFNIKGVPFYNNRAHCTFRLSRCNYAHKIIELANNKDRRVKAWKQVVYRKKNNEREMLTYLYYSHDLDHYIVILKEQYNNNKLEYFTFVTAYPVTKRYLKKRFIDDYNRAVKENRHYY